VEQKSRLAGELAWRAALGFLEGKDFRSSPDVIFPCTCKGSYEIFSFVDIELCPSILTPHSPKTQPVPAERRLGATLRLLHPSLSQTASPHSTHRESKRT
jgi:hypothetical protein